MKLPKRPGQVVGNGCHADQRGMQTLEVLPTEIVFISDVVSELNGAQAAGLRAVLCKRPGNHPQPESAYNIIQTFDDVLHDLKSGFGIR